MRVFMQLTLGAPYKVSRDRHILIISARANVINSVFVNECRVSALKEQGGSREGIK